MKTLPMPAANILAAYLHVQDGGTSVQLPVSDAFWEELSQGGHPELDAGRLLSAFSFHAPWATWERHPAGEELVMLLSGSATVVLEESGGDVREIALRAPGDYVLVPRGAWHTALTDEPTTMLFLTPGDGTEHRPA
jgi:mannose-6-phosphate isomerase-like protein (cupin superfamily)